MAPTERAFRDSSIFPSFAGLLLLASRPLRRRRPRRPRRSFFGVFLSAPSPLPLSLSLLVSPLPSPSSSRFSFGLLVVVVRLRYGKRRRRCENEEDEEEEEGERREVRQRVSFSSGLQFENVVARFVLPHRQKERERGEERSGERKEGNMNRE